ncbi:MAG: bifunctional protein-serine/threonine kinase/phosphatase [Betaproteobacteria bacterium]|nr:bifunctional protein-serine/threonine kinase/phosphatase [Betaproteobacteria bacterium]
MRTLQRTAPGRRVAPPAMASGTALQVATGYCSRAGPRKANEDFCGVVTPTGAELGTKGVIAALADGVSGGRGGREAAEYIVRGLLADYYATPDTWAVPQALDRVLNANNQWLLAQAVAHCELAGMATTLTALVLRGRRYVLAHVGDSRAYLWRDGRLARLTNDHVWDRPDMRHVLKRAIGLDPHLAVDYAEDQLRAGDVFVLASDGVWEPLGDYGMNELLREHSEPEPAARALAEAALAHGGQDNASAVVLRVERLPDGDMLDSLADGRMLPLPPRLKPGQAVDGYEVLGLLHESRATLLYKVRNRANGSLGVLKTLQPLLASDSGERAAIAAEEWLARRVVSHYFSQVLPAPERGHLYYVTSYHEGATLQQRLDTSAHFTVADAVKIGIRLAKGLGALHRLNIVHRDVKPSNIHLGADEKLRILDLGVALAAGAIHETGPGAPGTPSYMAPELFEGKTADAAADLYAAGVTLYHLLTRKYPYGEIEPFQHPKFGDPVPPTRYRPEIPGWLEAVLLKAVAREKKLRFETADEFLLALERGEHQPVIAPGRTPLAGRNPARFWRSIAAALFVLNLLLFYLLLAH